MSSQLLRALFPVLALVLATGCARDEESDELAPQPTDAEVFLDGFGPDVTFQAFANSKLDAVQIGYSETYHGSQSLEVTVPALGDASGWFAGGTFVTQSAGRDLSGYNALTFYVKASVAAVMGVAGFGNDNTGTSRYTVELADLAVDPGWKRVVLPIPAPAKLVNEKGLFHFAAGNVDGAGYTLWLDEVRFEQVAGLGSPQPALESASVQGEVGTSLSLDGCSASWVIDGATTRLGCMPAWFDFASSDSSVARPAGDGTLQILASGTATITASLNGVPATGSVTVEVEDGPATAAPTPTHSASEVVSLFSDSYTNQVVDTWSADWDVADVADLSIGGNAAKHYSNVSYAGIEFSSQPLDISAMNTLHLDLYVLDPSQLRLKLVDFGADGAYQGGDDSESEITLSTSGSPALVAGGWSSLDIPLSRFTGLAARSHLTQLIIAGTALNFYLDNFYFHSAGEVEEPTQPAGPAPVPGYPAANVVSLFSDSYSNVPVGTWSADWDMANVSQVSFSGNAAKLYSSLVFAGIEFTSPTIDAGAMTHLRMDIWTPDPTAAPATFKIKLVDFGADGAYQGGDDREHELTLSSASTPALATGGWVTLDLPLSQFTGLTTRAHLAQLILSGSLSTVYVDNVLLHN